MFDSSLGDVAILVVNDDYELAQQVCTWLRLVGAQVVGPVASEAEARRQIASGRRIDGAMLKCDLRDGSAKAIARALGRLDIPYGCVGARSSGETARGSVESPPMTAYAAVSALIELVTVRPRELVAA